MKNFKEEVISNMQNQEAAIRKLETQVDYLSKQISTPNPHRGTMANQKEECKEITLQSGMELKDTSKKTQEKNAAGDLSDKEERLQINIPFPEALEQMPLYAKFLKELMTKKRSWRNDETVVLTEKCSAIIQHKLPQKLKDPGSFQIPCIIGEITVEKALCDLGASANLMSLAVLKRMKIEEAKPTRMAL
ncbi:uncharacterized protein LOC107636501 [Arachis ipaensis]|uniref:uncharacterized protein LOC107636501 n=1 Tax=Arachis ipaensis TaxID=130454 RepID=UPI0007AFA378|nr:uncharacterized protein LOC107636501 [Arachis ipaensis]